MDNINDAMQLLRHIAQYKCQPFTHIGLGTLPIEESLVMDLGPSIPTQTHLDRTSMIDGTVIFNGKSSDRTKVLDAMCNVHRYLTEEVDLPIVLDKVQIYGIDTLSHPSFAKREISNPNQYLYTSSFRMRITYEGGKCSGS